MTDSSEVSTCQATAGSMLDIAREGATAKGSETSVFCGCGSELKSEAESASIQKVFCDCGSTIRITTKGESVALTFDKVEQLSKAKGTSVDTPTPMTLRVPIRSRGRRGRTPVSGNPLRVTNHDLNHNLKGMGMKGSHEKVDPEKKKPIIGLSGLTGRDVRNTTALRLYRLHRAAQRTRREKGEPESREVFLDELLLARLLVDHLEDLLEDALDDASECSN